MYLSYSHLTVNLMVFRIVILVGWIEINREKMDLHIACHFIVCFQKAVLKD